MLVIIISFAAALGLFLILFLALDWNFLLSMILAAALYAALAMLLQPEKKIGKIRISSLKNGGRCSTRSWERRERITTDSAEPWTGSRIRPCGRQGRNWRELRETSAIIWYRIRRKSAAATLYRLLSGDGGKYSGTLCTAAGYAAEHCGTRELAKKTSETVSVLKDAFALQFEKLMQNELMDMDADLNLLKQTLRGGRIRDKGQGTERG